MNYYTHWKVSHRMLLSPLCDGTYFLGPQSDHGISCHNRDQLDGHALTSCCCNGQSHGQEQGQSRSAQVPGMSQAETADTPSMADKAPL